MKYFTVFNSRFHVMVVLLSIAGVAFIGCKKGQTIEELGNYVVTTDDFNQYYNTQLERVTRLANVQKETVARALCAPSQPFEREIADAMDPERTYKKYRDSRIVEQVAQLDGFMDRPVIKRIVEQAMLEMVIQLYIQEKMEKHIRFTTEQKEEKCRELRQRDAARFGPLPLDQCVSFAERLLANEEFKRKYPQLMEEIKERVAVKKNAQFNKDDYIKKNVEGYRALRKSGGCPVDESPAGAGTKPTMEDSGTKTPLHQLPAPGLPSSK